MRHAIGRRIEGDRRPPEQQRAPEEQRVLDVVEERVLEGGIEQWREVCGPQHDREHEGSDQRVRQEPHDPRMEHRQHPPMARLRRRDPQDQRHRRGQRDERGSHEHQQDVLDHVDGEERRVVALDPGHEGEGDGDHRTDHRRGAPARHRVRRMGGVDGADRPPPPALARRRSRSPRAARSSSRRAASPGSAAPPARDRAPTPARRRRGPARRRGRHRRSRVARVTSGCASAASSHDAAADAGAWDVRPNDAATLRVSCRGPAPGRHHATNSTFGEGARSSAPAAPVEDTGCRAPLARAAPAHRW